MKTIQRRHFLAAATGAAVWPLPGRASDWQPTRPISWVVPYPAGGFGDALSRALAQKLGASLGQPVVVDNRPGAGGQIAAAHVLLQPADGHTIFYGDIGPFAMNAALYPRMNYETLRDFTPLTRLFTTPLLVVVPPANTLATFADLVRAVQTPNGLNYGSYGVGSQPHVWTEMLQQQLRGRLNHIPYKGAAPALQDLMSGQLDLMCDVAPSSIPLVRSGKLRALAVVGSERRLAQLPAVPTMTELGYPALNLPGWNATVLRAGTPAAALGRLHGEVVAALQAPDIVSRYAELGLAAAPQSSSQLGEFIRAETRRWGQAIRDAGVSIE